MVPVELGMNIEKGVHKLQCFLRTTVYLWYTLIWIKVGRHLGQSHTRLIIEVLQLGYVPVTLIVHIVSDWAVVSERATCIAAF